MGARQAINNTSSLDPQPALARLLETPEPLAGDAPLTVAAARLQQAGLPALPVVSDGRLVGLVTERSLLGPLAGDRADQVVCRDVVRPTTTVPVTCPPDEVLWLLRHDDVELIAVVGLDGLYQGVVSRRRMLDAVVDGRRPRVVGGLATPRGVFLTSVHHRGGVGDGSLVLTGLYLGLLGLAARVVVTVAVALASGDPLRATVAGLAPDLVPAAASPANSALWQTLVFLTLLRLSPLAGYHSGEHQTVHALERGLPLAYDHVVTMPRPHPRCGTNLSVVIGLAFWAWRLAATDAAWLAWLPWLAAAAYGRTLGRWVQQVFTTRPATRRQLEAGIAAGRLLVGRYQRQPDRRVNLALRIWNRGLLQVLAGLGITWSMAWLASVAAGWIVAGTSG